MQLYLFLKKENLNYFCGNIKILDKTKQFIAQIQIDNLIIKNASYGKLSATESIYQIIYLDSPDWHCICEPEIIDPTIEISLPHFLQLYKKEKENFHKIKDLLPPHQLTICSPQKIAFLPPSMQERVRQGIKVVDFYQDSHLSFPRASKLLILLRKKELIHLV